MGDILCVGEVLWDALPAGLFPGGAPHNVACHLHALGERAWIVSRVGQDVLGDEIIRRVRNRGMPTGLVQTDPVRPTGFVGVEFDAAGEPRYKIAEPAAWDAIEVTDELLRRARDAAALVFGSLAQRSAATAATLQQLHSIDALKVFDANLRPPYDRRDVVQRSLHWADVAKLNEAELRRLAEWFNLPQGLRSSTQALAEQFGCRMVCVTRGENGAALWTGTEWLEEPALRVAVVDSVGAGDAFLAALVSGILSGKDPRTTLHQANQLAARTAMRSGATPP